MTTFPQETADDIQELIDTIDGCEAQQMVVLGIACVLIGRTSDPEISFNNFVFNLRRLVDRLAGLESHTLQ